MINLQNHFTGTYAKNLLANWPVMMDFIRQKNTWLKDSIQTQSASNTLRPPTLSDQQISDAFNGPFHSFFKNHLDAHAHISKIETALTIQKDELFKEAEYAVDATLGVPQNILDKTEFTTLKEYHNKVDALAKEHYSQWEPTFQTWVDMFIQELKKNNVALNDIELTDFATVQPLSELNDLFINLKLIIPKLSKGIFDFQQYFTLKMVLVSQSALSRAHLPHGEKEIEQLLKSLKSSFKSIKETEETLTAAQQKAVNELLAPITWPNSGV